MSNFVNIRPNTKDPFLVNADTLSLIVHKYLDQGASTPKPTLSFHDHALGDQMWLDSGAANLDAGTIVSTLKAAGATLLALPLIDDVKGEYGTAYLNPKAFLTLIASATFTPDGKAETCANILLDVAGYGRLESDQVPVRVIDAFMKDIAAVKPALMTVLPDVATARFSKPGYVTLDAAKVTSIRPNGYDIDVGLQDGVIGGSRIDFIMKKGTENIGQLNHSYANAVWKRAERMKVKGMETPEKLGVMLQEIFARADIKAERARLALKETLAATIATQNPDLIKIKDAKDVYYAAPAQISSIHCHGKNVSLQFRSADHHKDSLYIHFETPDKACREAIRLQNIMSGGPSADINKPTLSLKRLKAAAEQGKTPKAP